MQLAKPSLSLEGRAGLYFTPHVKISGLKVAEHDGKYIDEQLNRNFFVFLLSCLAVKSNNIFCTCIKGAFLVITLIASKSA